MPGAKIDCLNGSCGRYKMAAKGGYATSLCANCGFNKKEDERRKKLPLIKGKDGLYRKHVGKERKVD